MHTSSTLLAPTPAAIHPLDPQRLSAFDYFEWRLLRRTLAYSISQFARRRRAGGTRIRIAAAAHALECEFVMPAIAQEIATLLAIDHQTEPLSLATALRSAHELVGAEQVSVDSTFPADRARGDAFGPSLLEPDWDAIGVGGAQFDGFADGLRCHASLPIDGGRLQRPIPYSISWHLSRGPAHLQDIEASRGVFLEQAAGVWDWLVARRFTLAEQAGELPPLTKASSPLLTPILAPLSRRGTVKTRAESQQWDPFPSID